MQRVDERGCAAPPHPWDQLVKETQQVLHESLTRALRGVVGREDIAEEVAQDAYLRAWFKRDSCPSDHHEALLWILKFAENEASNARRRFQVRRTHSIEELVEHGWEPASRDPEPESVLIAEEEGDLIAVALSHLDEVERVLIMRVDLEELSLGSVAAALGLSESGARKRLRRVHLNIANRLRKREG